MVFKKRYDETVRKTVKELRLNSGYKLADICKATSLSLATVKRILKEPEESAGRKEKRKRLGRPRLLDKRDERNLIRQVRKFRKEDYGGHFTLKDLRNAVGLDHIPIWTIRRTLRRHGIAFRVARRKGKSLINI